MSATGWRMIIAGGLVLLGPRFIQGQTISHDQQTNLTRNYLEGEKLSYQMKAVNEGHVSTLRYEARADARVEREPSGLAQRIFAWIGLLVNGQPVPLTPASRQFRENLSLCESPIGPLLQASFQGRTCVPPQSGRGLPGFAACVLRDLCAHYRAVRVMPSGLRLSPGFETPA